MAAGSILDHAESSGARGDRRRCLDSGRIGRTRTTRQTKHRRRLYPAAARIIQATAPGRQAARAGASPAWSIRLTAAAHGVRLALMRPLRARTGFLAAACASVAILLTAVAAWPASHSATRTYSTGPFVVTCTSTGQVCSPPELLR